MIFTFIDKKKKKKKSRFSCCKNIIHQSQTRLTKIYGEMHNHMNRIQNVDTMLQAPDNDINLIRKSDLTKKC